MEQRRPLGQRHESAVEQGVVSKGVGGGQSELEQLTFEQQFWHRESSILVVKESNGNNEAVLDPISLELDAQTAFGSKGEHAPDCSLSQGVGCHLGPILALEVN